MVKIVSQKDKNTKNPPLTIATPSSGVPGIVGLQVAQLGGCVSKLRIGLHPFLASVFKDTDMLCKSSERFDGSFMTISLDEAKREHNIRRPL